jgi:hypothetical protein
MKSYRVRLIRDCVNAGKWQLLCEFAEDPMRFRVCREDFTTEDAIIEKLHDEGVLVDPVTDISNLMGWVTLSSEQLLRLSIPEIYTGHSSKVE